MSGSNDDSPPDGTPHGASWQQEYWRRNLRLVVTLLAIWAVVSLGASVLFIDVLNEITIAGFPVGFWFAQQGSIYTFIILILVYAVRMDRLDEEFDVAERDENGDRL